MSEVSGQKMSLLLIFQISFCSKQKVSLSNRIQNRHVNGYLVTGKVYFQARSYLYTDYYLSVHPSVRPLYRISLLGVIVFMRHV